jgi:hypothetical protein
MVNKKWQWHALTMLRQTLATPAVNRLVNACYRRYPDGFIANVQRSDAPARYQTLATYLANLAERRAVDRGLGMCRVGVHELSLRRHPLWVDILSALNALASPGQARGVRKRGDRIDACVH